MTRKWVKKLLIFTSGCHDITVKKIILVVSCGLERQMYVYQCVRSVWGESRVPLTPHSNPYVNVTLMHDSVKRFLNFSYHLAVSDVVGLGLILSRLHSKTLAFKCVSDQTKCRMQIDSLHLTTKLLSGSQLPVVWSMSIDFAWLQFHQPCHDEKKKPNPAS